ncbi:MAG: cobalamin-binding protein [Deltaproteobacteria bacterium]|nr:MAG: cobalamin-binding protein [Deltaproteobacteria bacterium]
MAIQDIFAAVLDFEEDKIADMVQAEIDGGSDLEEVLNNGLIAAMDEVGAKFSAGELFVPEMLMAAQTMKAGLDVLKPMLAEGTSESRGTIIIGTVKGDLHDIGKNLVAMMLEGAGFDVIDLGVDVDTDAFLAAAEKHDADAICMSALLTTTMPAMESTVKAIVEKGLPYKAMVGGAPVTDAFAKKIGANYSEDAPSAVELARRLIAA